MSKLIEMGMFMPDWGIKAVRVGSNAFVALVSSERAWTRPVIVIRAKRRFRDPSDFNTPDNPGVENNYGFWTRLHKPGYVLKERSSVTIYGGEGPFDLTPQRILTATSEELTGINEALSSMLTRAIQFAKVATNSA